MAETEILAFKQADRENFLIGMMKINYLKRLESSIESFEISLDRTIQKIENLEKKINDFLETNKENQEESLDNFTPNEEELEENGEDLDQWQVGKKLKFDLADLELGRWQLDLQKDKDALIDLLNNARAVTPERDAKLKELKNLIIKKIASPINRENKKVIVFTAFTDTAQYLYDNIKDWYVKEFKLHCALVCGNYTQTTLGKNDYDSILVNFSPLSKNRSMMASLSQEEEIDLLIASDCISEGQNLQDCDYLVNYDIHWNPVRIIQRFGRIDRLGSINKTIQLVNFWPTKDLDNYINLKERVEARMVLLDVSATGEENLIEVDAVREMKDLEYRKKQLEKLQTEVVDLEDISGGISITDLTFNDFKVELMDYMKHSRKLLDEAPFGMYAVTKIEDELRDIVKPGVIFTLRQIKGQAQTKEQNALFPYYTVYISEDGEIKLNFLHAKKVLDYYKKLCSGQSEVIMDLVKGYNEETEDGRNMGKYSNLLEIAIKNLIGKKQEVGVAGLFSKGGGILQTTFFDGIEDFELVTFLILK